MEMFALSSFSLVRSVDTNQHYSSTCGVENTILAFYILLMILSCIVFVFILWDTALLIIFAFQRKKGFTLGMIRLGL